MAGTAALEAMTVLLSRTHNKSADYGSNDGRKEYGAPLHACLGQHGRVHDDDVCHCEESGQTCSDFCTDIRMIAL